MKTEELKLTTRFLARDLNVALAEQDMNEQIILGLLEERMKWLLANNVAALTNSFYRMDIPESIFLASSEDINPARFLAEAVFKRTKQKVATRLRYKELNDYEN